MGGLVLEKTRNGDSLFFRPAFPDQGQMNP